MEISRMTPQQDAIKTEIDAAQAALECYGHISEASSAEITRARKALVLAIDTEMPEQIYVGLQRHLSIFDRPARKAETRGRLGD